MTTDTAHLADAAQSHTTKMDLATERTVMAADRTLMAWVRTALSMNGFGFTIYQFLRALSQEHTAAAAHVPSARTIGLFLTGLGTVSMLVGIIEHQQTLRSLGVHGTALFRPAVGVAVLVFALGALLFLTISVPALAP